MNIKTNTLRGFSTLLVLAWLACTLPLQAQTVLFSEDFESTTTTGDLNGKSTSDGNATYSVTKTNSVFQSRAASEDKITAGLGSYIGQIYGNATNQPTWITMSPNLNATANYTFKIDYLLYAGTGQFGINARSDTQNANCSFRLTWSGGTASFSYVDAQGSATLLGTVTATASEKASSFYLRNIVVTVTGNTQQLSVNGTTIGGVVATQGTVNDAANDQIRFYGISGSGAVDIRLDNLSATTVAVPEPSTASMLFGATMLITATALGAMRRHR
ncbi:hypothetical protein [Geminisphaera colitermitum]|uniref:hypothetical protein n=1 Tax=Geminisphaera colitermitum TaxID=1148786 RepID=UPI0005B99CAE|nr:hypothetical protein [Geminisphaera colitermitum]